MPLFLDHHASGNLQLDAKARESYRGHPISSILPEWVARYDQTAIKPNTKLLPLEFFESMVYQVFTRPSKGVKIHC